MVKIVLEQIMRRSFVAALFGCCVSLILASPDASAADGSWGCEVLLCAASSNPSWRGVPYCVPPMVRLITAMKLPGFSWPICEGAGTGVPGHEKYEACPSGYSIGFTRSDSDSHPNSEPDLCEKAIDRCNQHYAARSDSGSCIETIRIRRPLRDRPYYFDLPQHDGSTQRVWFELNP